MGISRRALVLSTIAVALAPAASVNGAASTLPPPPDFGYSLGHGDVWTTGFASHAEAAAEAMQYADPGESIVTAITTRRQLHFPNMAESVIEGFANGINSLADIMVSSLQGANEDNDFEGDFAIASSIAHPGDMEDKARPIVRAAFIRHGQGILADVLLNNNIDYDTIDWADPVFDALCADQQMNMELSEIMKSWIEKHDLEKELRRLDIDDQREHIASEVEVS